MYRQSPCLSMSGPARLCSTGAPRRFEHCFSHHMSGLQQPQFIYPCVSLRGLSRQQRTLAQALTIVDHPSSASTSGPPVFASEPLVVGKSWTASTPNPPTFVRTTGRIVAIGDIHGDISKAIAALEMAGVLSQDSEGRPLWCGDNTIVVQLGDVLDRGDSEIGVIMLLRELDRQARSYGGALFMLNGNHESLNVCGNFRYATEGGTREAAIAAGLHGLELENGVARIKARTRMYAPGGPMAVELSKNPTVLVVNDTVFAHGGVTPEHVKYGLERLNMEVAAWMRGDVAADGSLAPPPFLAMGDTNSVMWNRQFGREEFAHPFERYTACALLKETLKMLSARQLVVGHTIQMGGANCECNGRVWRMDVGMSSGILDAMPQLLEIQPEQDGQGQCQVRLLTSNNVASENLARLPYVLPKFGQGSEERFTRVGRVAAPSQGPAHVKSRDIPRSVPSVACRGFVEARKMPATVA